MESAEGSNPFGAGFEAAAPAAAPSIDDAFGAPQAAAAAAPIDNGLGDGGGAAGSGGGAPLDDSLFGGAVEESNGADPPAAEATPAAFAAPAFDDPRIQWDTKHQAVLAKRAADEAAAKKEVLAKAKAFLDKQAKERDALLSKRKTTNRDLEKTSNVAAGAVPSGDKPWDRVLSVITFNREDAKGQHVTKDTFKEKSRFKAVLLAAKAAGVPVSA